MIIKNATLGWVREDRLIETVNLSTRYLWAINQSRLTSRLCVNPTLLVVALPRGWIHSCNSTRSLSKCTHLNIGQIIATRIMHNCTWRAEINWRRRSMIERYALGETRGRVHHLQSEGESGDPISWNCRSTTTTLVDRSSHESTIRV